MWQDFSDPSIEHYLLFVIRGEQVEIHIDFCHFLHTIDLGALVLDGFPRIRGWVEVHKACEEGDEIGRMIFFHPVPGYRENSIRFFGDADATTERSLQAWREDTFFRCPLPDVPPGNEVNLSIASREEILEQISGPTITPFRSVHECEALEVGPAGRVEHRLLALGRDDPFPTVCFVGHVEGTTSRVRRVAFQVRS